MRCLTQVVADKLTGAEYSFASGAVGLQQDSISLYRIAPHTCRN